MSWISTRSLRYFGLVHKQNNLGQFEAVHYESAAFLTIVYFIMFYILEGMRNRSEIMFSIVCPGENNKQTEGEKQEKKR